MNVCVCMFVVLSCETLPAERLIHLAWVCGALLLCSSLPTNQLQHTHVHNIATCGYPREAENGKTQNRPSDAESGCDSSLLCAGEDVWTSFERGETESERVFRVWVRQSDTCVAGVWCVHTHRDAHSVTVCNSWVAGVG